ncbi:hypothetical protein BpHYR1_053559 [Brachionus plicatilis]|uniref:Uncharacterized protein n=1 Tax=Brachionus plicatilis TaxID=10195 RepID=A0A3M7RRU0_BRAPC|nr:hypothetical protein BpHYR1_053559 [Brachionus plicatilis]
MFLSSTSSESDSCDSYNSSGTLRASIRKERILHIRSEAPSAHIVSVHFILLAENLSSYFKE